MLPLFEQFIKEKRFIQNVSDATISWYTFSLKWLKSERPTDEDLKDMVVRMREHGLKATGCNAVTPAVNVYLHWVNGS